MIVILWSTCSSRDVCSCLPGSFINRKYKFQMGYTCHPIRRENPTKIVSTWVPFPISSPPLFDHIQFHFFILYPVWVIANYWNMYFLFAKELERRGDIDFYYYLHLTKYISYKTFNCVKGWFRARPRQIEVFTKGSRSNLINLIALLCSGHCHRSGLDFG